MQELLKEVRACTICAAHLPLGPRPVLSIHPDNKILIIGQAPGLAVHESGIPWQDKSGDNLRKWSGISDQDFYESHKLGILPMGFCYPGKGGTGDLPPRKECAPQWHEQLINALTQIELCLLIGQYAQAYYLGNNRKRNLTETVRNYREYLPNYFVLPHPSPLNNRWMAKNPWFAKTVLPHLKEEIAKILMM